MSKFLGANWRTSISGIGAAVASLLAALSTISLTTEGQALLAFMSTDQKWYVAVGSAIAAVALKFWNSILQKDKSVTGGTVQQTADNKVADPVQVGGVSVSVADTFKAEPKE